ncbi:hypothetical protein [Sphingomonas aracearum]|uniref:Uncharacterized protein n=1 Tax=Sphingomonas aracearum TaxID=2283317 RepID=A0A369VVV1_9SPHN|nr:hypothetical protein [Sphingomonas aracearum]RDE06468.1 hypothetical protein DVW87_01775 [Sphingomonas aracearum]
MTMVSTVLVFAFAFALVAWVFAFTLVPALPRIRAVLAGREDPALASQHRIVIGERRRTRSFAGTSAVTAPVANWRVAA